MDAIFGIILTLCRTVYSGDSESTNYQIKRLADAYKKKGCDAESRSLQSLLGQLHKKQPLHSSVLKTSSENKISGEELTRQVPIPVDKETASPLLEVIYSEDLPTYAPMFDDNIQEAVNSVILEWENYSQLLSLNAEPSRSCLIFGEPGTGKTHLAEWIAQQVGLPVVLARLDGIMSSFLGTSARNIGILFSFANRYRCVLLLDEFDAIAKLRDDPQEVGEVKRIVNTLLPKLDERDKCGFTIGVTNHEQLLDSAVWRRFDIQIEIPKPSSTVINLLLKKYMEPIELNDTENRFLSWCIQGSSGADVQKLSNWLKRIKILPDYSKENVVDLMRRYSILNAGRISEKVKSVLNGTNESMITWLKDNDLNFRQKDIAEIFQVSQSSVSKQLAKLNKED